MYKLALIAALLLFATAAARAVTSGYKARLQQLEAEAAAQRKKLGLDADAKKLYAQYPTPEVTLAADPQPLACGQAASLRLDGTFPKGTAFVLDDDDVQVLEEKAGKGWEARVKVAAAAAPRDVIVSAIAPVSGAVRSLRIAQVRGRYDLDLRFPDGWTAHFATAPSGARPGRLEGEIAWKKGAESRTTPAAIEADGGRLRVRWQRSQEEIDAQNASMQKMQKLGLQEVAQRSSQRVQDCLKLADAARNACFQAASKQNDAEMKVVNQKMEALREETENALPTAAWGCSEIRLEASAGALAGAATCAPHERKVNVTGTLRCAGGPE